MRSITDRMYNKPTEDYIWRNEPELFMASVSKTQVKANLEEEFTNASVVLRAHKDNYVSIHARTKSENEEVSLLNHSNTLVAGFTNGTRVFS